jgi:hypothetical protein
MKRTRDDSQQRTIPFTLLQGLPGVQLYDGDEGYQPAEENTSITATKAVRGSGYEGDDGYRPAEQNTSITATRVARGSGV